MCRSLVHSMALSCNTSGSTELQAGPCKSWHPRQRLCQSHVQRHELQCMCCTASQLQSGVVFLSVSFHLSPLCRLHRLCALSIQLLYGLVPLVFHHPSLLEISDLFERPVSAGLHALALPSVRHCISTQFPRSSHSSKDGNISTYPTPLANFLKLLQLRRTQLPSLFILFHRVDDPMLI